MRNGVKVDGNKARRSRGATSDQEKRSRTYTSRRLGPFPPSLTNCQSHVSVLERVYFSQLYTLVFVSGNV